MKSWEKKQKTLTQKFKVFPDTDERFKNRPSIISLTFDLGVLRGWKRPR